MTRQPLAQRAQTPSYFVVMMEYARGRESIVDPEITRREVLSRILSGEYPADEISFIHFIACGEALDVTDELLSEVRSELPCRDAPLTGQAALEAQWDHDRALRNETT